MKHFILKQLANYLNGFNIIKFIKRTNNNVIKIEFNDKQILYFDMVKGDAKVYKQINEHQGKKNFNAPFDIVLQKRFINSKLKKVYLRNDDKILDIEVASKSAYKEQITTLQFEFTGKNTNVIILDDNDIVLEALRHIDEWTSSRIVKAGQKLLELPKPTFQFEQKVCDDFEQYLYNVYKKQEQQQLVSLQKQKLSLINKQANKIKKILNELEDEEVLNQKAKELNSEATIIVATLYEYSGYQKNIKLKQSQDMFRDSKKLKNKAKNQYIEKNNLIQKLDFYNRLIATIKSCNTTDEIEFYLPKKDKNQTKTKKANPYQSFFIDGFKIMLGRDERENIYLLENSKANDFWFHLQNQPSSHVIVSNTKKEIPQKIIEEAAKICTKFSLDISGTFRVDYTQRRNVKIQTKANVLYNPYNTIVIKI